MEVAEALAKIKKINSSEDDLNFKVAILKYFWDNRDREIIPKALGIEKQKFLFFYNLFAFINNKQYTFDNLKAFEQGPIYHDVFTLTYRDKVYLEQIKSKPVNYDFEILKIACALIEIFGDIGSSNLTHGFDMWKNKYDPNLDEQSIVGNNSNNITAADISEEDKNKAKLLFNELKEVIQVFTKYLNDNNKVLLIEKKNFDQIVSRHNSELNKIDRTVVEPVYVYLLNGELHFD